MVDAYKDLYNGEEPVVEGIHAGLSVESLHLSYLDLMLYHLDHR